MRILLDHTMPHALRQAFAGHDVVTVAYMGWGDVRYGALLTLAEASFDVFVMLDKSLPDQHDTSKYNLVILVFDVHPATPDALRRLARGITPRLGTFRKRSIHWVRSDGA